jgi:hypothetical protein
MVIGPATGAGVGVPGPGIRVVAPAAGTGVESGDAVSLIIAGGCIAAVLGAASAVADAGAVVDAGAVAAAAAVDEGEAYTTVGAGGRLSTPGSSRA